MCTRLALPGVIKVIQLTCLFCSPAQQDSSHGEYPYWAGNTLSSWQKALSIAWSLHTWHAQSSFLKGKSCHANLVAHSLCHMSELKQVPWPLVIEPVTSVPTKTPIYRCEVAQSLMRWLRWTPPKARTPHRLGWWLLLWIRTFEDEDTVNGRKLVLYSCMMRGHCSHSPKSAGCVGPKNLGPRQHLSPYHSLVVFLSSCLA